MDQAKNLMRWSAGALAALALVSIGYADGSTGPANATPAPEASVSETAIRKSVEERLNVKVESITRSPVAGFYEVRVANKVYYADPSGQFLFVGSLIDLHAGENLTAKRNAELGDAALPKVKLADLPLDSAIKIVRGNGKRTLVAFEDPNCAYCKKLEKTFDSMTDYTLYVFLYPILGDDSVTKSRAIWCSADRAKAWEDWMHKGAMGATHDCANPIDKNVALGEKLEVSATPTMFFASGKRVPGAIDASDIAREFALQ